jgi:hypothetical protein
VLLHTADVARYRDGNKTDRLPTQPVEQYRSAPQLFDGGDFILSAGP